MFQEPVGESIYNLYTDVVYIIPDEIAQVLLPVQSNRFVMTQYPLPFKTAEMLEQLLGRSYPEDPDKDNLAGYSTTVHTTEVNRIIALNFILKASLIYGAIVLMVMCLTVLALQQLLDIDREAFFGQRFRIAVAEQEILYSFDELTFCSEIASQTVGIQTFHHYTAFNIAAACPALTAGKGKLVFGADWLDLIHDFFIHFVPP